MLDLAFAGGTTSALVYFLLLFGLGAAEHVRYGLGLGCLSLVVSAVMGKVAPGFLPLFGAQIGLFTGISMLRLLLSALVPRNAGPERVSASHRNAAADEPLAGEGFARGLLAMLVVGAVLVTPLVLLALMASRVDESVWQFMMITGVVGIAIVIMILWPYVVVLLHLFSWMLRRGSQDR